MAVSRIPSFPHALLLSKLLYLGLVALTLGVAAIGHPHPGRGFAVEFGVGLGFVGFVMLACQFALTAKFRWISRVVGLDSLLHFHRQIGFFSYGFILLHVGILLLAQPGYAGFLDPRVDLLRALALWTALLALTALLVSTLWREELGISYEWWRVGHGLLALLILFIGLVHILRVGWYVSSPVKQGFWIGGSLVALGLLAYARVVKPLRARDRPWIVTKVRPERGRSWTLELAPERHGGISFQPGQFLWLTLAETPLFRVQHPFSISSGATGSECLQVTVKELGDHTSRIGEVKPGTTAFVDGPYGNFVLDDGAEEAVFIAGGVGITPVMSILRTLRHGGHPVPSLLIYGVSVLEAATFLEELEEMAKMAGEGERGEMGEAMEGAGRTEPEGFRLRLVLVVEEASEGWEGETGFVTPALLDRHLPRDHSGVRYFVCGPEPMMDEVEAHLRLRGVPLSRTHAERFNIA